MASKERHSPDFSLNLPAVDSLQADEDIIILEQFHSVAIENIMPPLNQGTFSSMETSRYPTPSLTASSRSVASEVPRPMTSARTLTLAQAEELLESFRSRCSFFPFVLFRPGSSVQSLSRESPFLLLAILTIASGFDMQLQTQMNQEFKRVLSSEVVMEGRKSLDFLQGLLIYLAVSIFLIFLIQACLGKVLVTICTFFRSRHVLMPRLHSKLPLKTHG